MIKQINQLLSDESLGGLKKFHLAPNAKDRAELFMDAITKYEPEEIIHELRENAGNPVEVIRILSIEGSESAKEYGYRV